MAIELNSLLIRLCIAHPGLLEAINKMREYKKETEQGRVFFDLTLFPCQCYKLEEGMSQKMELPLYWGRDDGDKCLGQYSPNSLRSNNSPGLVYDVYVRKSRQLYFRPRIYVWFSPREINEIPYNKNWSWHNAESEKAIPLGSGWPSFGCNVWIADVYLKKGQVFYVRHPERTP